MAKQEHQEEGGYIPISVMPEILRHLAARELSAAASASRAMKAEAYREYEHAEDLDGNGKRCLADRYAALWRREHRAFWEMYRMCKAHSFVCSTTRAMAEVESRVYAEYDSAKNARVACEVFGARRGWEDMDAEEMEFGYDSEDRCFGPNGYCSCDDE